MDELREYWRVKNQEWRRPKHKMNKNDVYMLTPRRRYQDFMEGKALKSLLVMSDGK